MERILNYLYCIVYKIPGISIGKLRKTGTTQIVPLRKACTLPPDLYLVCGSWAFEWLPPGGEGKCTFARLTPVAFLPPQVSVAAADVTTLGVLSVTTPSVATSIVTTLSVTTHSLQTSTKTNLAKTTKYSLATSRSSLPDQEPSNPGNWITQWVSILQNSFGDNWGWIVGTLSAVGLVITISFPLYAFVYYIRSRQRELRMGHMGFRERGLMLCSEIQGGGISQDNSIWLLHQQTARQLNATDCWICSHIPANHKGIPLIGIPLTMHELNVTDYSYTVQLDVNHTDQNALSIQGTYLEIAGISVKPTVCVGLMYTYPSDHGHFYPPFPKVHVGKTNCENAILSFTMRRKNKTCDNQSTDCNLRCWCAAMNASCAPKCACPQSGEEGCETALHDNMRWLLTWLANHGGIVPRALKQGIYYLCGNRAYSWLPMGGWGNCTIGRVVPAVRGRSEISPEEIVRMNLGKFPHRERRELFTTSDKAWMWFPAWTGWGITLANKLNQYAAIMDGIINKNY
ncbi:hypothetical protein GDO78_022354 [Eleutherodactylus coqui]|uniref:Uncharacterized protein n=1 Tax=Eleutherodactylus coqui TaxID=57060 RepID=A0A8J6B2W2_ELECQ|nr:hypothetical protein GDO78_022354 [Eleutherodactylus coqui]